MFTTEPTGKLIHGHVLDCSKAGVEHMLKRYDSQLYVTWNEVKYNGWGCWEVRRRPDQRSIKDIYALDGYSIVEIDYVEIDIVNHVLDVPYLNYGVMKRIKEMDAWRDTQWVKSFEDAETDNIARHKKKNSEDLRYKLRYNRTMARDLQQAILDGVNPARILQYWVK